MSKFILLTTPVVNTAVLLNTDCIEGAFVDDDTGYTEIFPTNPGSGKYTVKERPETIYKLIEQATTLPEPIPCKTASTDDWHDLKKHPNDLPPQSTTGAETVFVKDIYGALWLAYCDCGKWFSDDTGVPLEGIVKWRYIPE